MHKKTKKEKEQYYFERFRKDYKIPKWAVNYFCVGFVTNTLILFVGDNTNRELPLEDMGMTII